MRHMDEAAIRESQRIANLPAEFTVQVVVDVSVHGRYNEAEAKAEGQIQGALGAGGVIGRIRSVKFLGR